MPLHRSPRPLLSLVFAAVLVCAADEPLEAQRRLSLEQPVSGRISSFSPSADGWHYHEFEFSMSRQERVHFILNSFDTPMRLQFISRRTGRVASTHEARPGHVTWISYTVAEPLLVRVMSRSPTRYHFAVSREERTWLVEESSNVTGFFATGAASASFLRPEGQEFEDLGLGFPLGTGIGLFDRFAVFGRLIWEQMDDTEESALMTYEGGARLYFMSALSELRPYLQASGGVMSLEPPLGDDSRATFFAGGAGLLWFIDEQMAIELGASYGIATFDADALRPGRAPAGRLWLGLSWHPFH